MRRPVKPVPQPTVEEERRERRFTKRLLWLALAGSLFGGALQVVLRPMGKHPMPRPPGTMPAPQRPAVDDDSGK